MNNTTKSSVQILLYGRDDQLLHLRGLLLKTIGYSSAVALNVEALRHLLCDGIAFNLAVLCHTTPEYDRRWITEYLHTAHKCVSVYCLNRTLPPTEFLVEVKRRVAVGIGCFNS